VSDVTGLKRFVLAASARGAALCVLTMSVIAGTFVVAVAEGSLSGQVVVVHSPASTTTYGRAIPVGDGVV
jgi:hypothetical protein